MSESNPDVVMLVPWYPSDNDFATYGGDDLAEAGLRVIFADCSPLLSGGDGDAGDTERRHEIVRVRDRGELESLIADRAPGALFVDFLAGVNEFGSREFPVFRALGRHGAKWCVIAAGSLPPVSRGESAASATARLVHRIRRAFDVRRLAEYLLRRLLRPVRRLTSLLGGKPRLFGTHAEVVDAFARRLGIPAEEIVWVNSLDFSRYRHWLDARGGQPPERLPIAVFLDEAASSHPDFEYLGAEHLMATDAVYSAAMTAFFDELEERTGLEVVVAAHPKAEYESRPGFFGDRRIERGRTIDLVANAQLVVAHSTTAVTFPALMDTPIVIVQTREMAATGYSAQVAATAAALGLHPVTIDDVDQLSAIEWDWTRWPRGGFADYLARYVRSPEAGDETTWETVTRTLTAGSGASS